MDVCGFPDDINALRAVGPGNEIPGTRLAAASHGGGNVPGSVHGRPSSELDAVQEDLHDRRQGEPALAAMLARGSTVDGTRSG